MARELPYIQAIGEAVHQEMVRDETVIYFGQNLGLTEDDPYVKAFGGDRVRVTPISETAEIGMAVGAAFAGFRPVVQLYMAEFMLVAMDQVVNEAPRFYGMSGGEVKVPIVLQAGYGFTAGWAGQHTGTIYGMFMGVPGLKVVVPSTPADERRRAERRTDHLAFLAAPLGRLQPLLEQLQVGEDAGQRGAQLVRGVGDELALRLHHLLRLRAGRVELAEHLLQGAGQLADLVVGPRIGDPERGVSRGGDLPRPCGERGTGRIARPAIAIPARAASRVPPSTPPARNSHSRLIVASRLSVLRPYWT